MLQLIRIATRKSPLALWQANFVRNRLLNLYPNLSVELIPIITQGDILLDTPLAKIGGKGLFVKQLEQALLDNEADIAVHSMKDLPVFSPKGLILLTILQREDARDAFISNRYGSLDELPPDAVVGTSSLRRQCQIKARYPFVTTSDLRGNIGTRLEKLDDNKSKYDAIILAVAGLKRLGLTHRITSILDVDQMLPAMGQGALGIQTRINDSAIHALLAPLDHTPTQVCLTAERALNRTLQGSCQVPIGCYATLDNNTLSIRGLVSSLDGKNIIYHEKTGPAEQAKTLGTDLAVQLLNNGAKQILDNILSKS